VTPTPSTPYAAGPRRRPRVLRWLALALLVVPIVEVAAIIGVGKVIGAWPTILLLLVESALGAWLVRREGSRAWQALSGALSTGAMPSKELTDAALVLVGGTLLLTPGFVTDIVGFFFILPFTRPMARGLLEAAVARRLLREPAPRASGPDGPTVIQGKVVD
jgi:UPF0716 protein FxsA